MTAPEAEGMDQRGQAFRISDLRGQWVVLYFYPKDESPGCTAEACAFRDEMESLTTLGAVVIGVSTQDQESHRRFAERHDLRFRLIADVDGRIARDYDARGSLGLTRRITYIIDPAGVIRDAYRSELSPGNHADRAKVRLQELGSQAPSPK